jgi:two-component system sensor histidine kinase AlgZ
MCGVRALFGVVIIGELLAIILTLIGSGTNPGALERLSMMSLFIQWIGLSAAAVLCLSRRVTGRLPENGAAVLSYLLILIVVYLIAEIVWWLINPLSGGTPLISLTRADFLIRSLGISAIVAALVLRYFFVQHHWKLQMVSETEARLDALQARIRPHFLFNCMNTIASLTRSEPTAAERAIEDLADLFRASMAEARTLATFEEEFDLVRGYLNIEALRLGERLRLQWDIDAVPLETKVPLLTLQPLVENAIYHGIEPLADGGVIKIAAARHTDRVTITVSNPVTERTNPHQRGNRLAQDNVRQRLLAQFGRRGGLEIELRDGRYNAVVTIPLAR